MNNVRECLKCEKFERLQQKRMQKNMDKIILKTY